MTRQAQTTRELRGSSSRYPAILGVRRPHIVTALAAVRRPVIVTPSTGSYASGAASMTARAARVAARMRGAVPDSLLSIMRDMSSCQREGFARLGPRETIRALLGRRAANRRRSTYLALGQPLDWAALFPERQNPESSPVPGWICERAAHRGTAAALLVHALTAPNAPNRSPRFHSAQGDSYSHFR